MIKILAVDDDIVSVTILKNFLQKAGYNVTTAIDGESAIELVKKKEFDIVITDFNMPGMNGIELTKEILKFIPNAVIILITAYISVKAALESIKLGAFDYLTKPIDKDELLIAVERGLERMNLLKDSNAVKNKLEDKPDEEFTFRTMNKNIKALLEEVLIAAKSDSTILITGSNGTGKEVLAEYIYRNSLRSDNQFIVVNCAAIPEQLLESELFGHAKGSFTGAIKDHKGYFEIADKGTIFLDEIGEMDPLLQVKLLRVLQQRQFSRVGDPKIIKTNVRIIAATNKNLRKLITEDKFREDLYYRLNVFEYHLLDLKDRVEDITFYFKFFVKEFSHQNNKVINNIKDEVNTALCNYVWPGNVRELKNIAERATVLCRTDTITPELLPSIITEYKSTDITEDEELMISHSNDYLENKNALLKEFEIKFIKKHLKLNSGNIKKTAEAINFHPVSLRQKMQKLGIHIGHKVED